MKVLYVLSLISYIVGVVLLFLNNLEWGLAMLALGFLFPKADNYMRGK